MQDEAFDQPGTLGQGALRPGAIGCTPPFSLVGALRNSSPDLSLGTKAAMAHGVSGCRFGAMGVSHGIAERSTIKPGGTRTTRPSCGRTNSSLR